MNQPNVGNVAASSPLGPVVRCCVCDEVLLDEEKDLGYCEDCRHGHGDLEGLLEAAL